MTLTKNGVIAQDLINKLVQISEGNLNNEKIQQERDEVSKENHCQVIDKR